MKIYNTLTRSLEEVVPIENNHIRMYNCGPTVYFYPHIGNWRSFIFADTLRRSLEYLGYQVTQVMNITDVGHLVTDEDAGEDKMEKGAKRENKTVWEVAQFYIDDFLVSRERLNILPPQVLCRATEHIQEQIDMIQKLIDNGFAYATPEAVYFDVAKFASYTKLSGQKLEDKEIGVRKEVVIDEKYKKNPQDFRLWQLDRPDHQMQWDSPWGKGFPGWHIECSAMSIRYLGQPFEIHTGGVDHIPVHHTNEIAQSEAANGMQFVKYWMHNEHLSVDSTKMSKSLGNTYTLQDIDAMIREYLDGVASKNAPLALRYLFLTAHYSNKMDFTKESLFTAFNTLFEIYKAFADFFTTAKEMLGEQFSFTLAEGSEHFKNAYTDKLQEYVENDLDTASVIAQLHILIKDPQMTPVDKLWTMVEYDKILGLGFITNTLDTIFTFTAIEQDLIDKRTRARQERNFALSDEIRDMLVKQGIEANDQRETSTYYRK